MVTKPNFFILGAPKSGTTAMSEYLRTHPNVFVSDLKEPHFFCEDVSRSSIRSINEYLDLFSQANHNHAIIAEATTNYIHSRIALEKIKEFQPIAKLMVMLRRPTDLVYAFHGENLRQGIESEQDFERAWWLQQTRAAGRALPPGCRSPHRLQYKWIGSLGSQVQKLLRIFPESQVHFALFDNFATHPEYEYHKLLTFLGVPHDGRREFPRINESIRYKWPWLGQFPKRLRGHVAGPLAMLRHNTGLRGTGFLKTIDRFNAVPAQRPPLRLEFQRHLTEVFRDEVKLLEELLDQDLSAWRDTKEGSSTP